MASSAEEFSTTGLSSLRNNTRKKETSELQQCGQEERSRLAVLLRKKVLDTIEVFVEGAVEFHHFKNACETVFDRNSFTDLAEERSLAGLCGYAPCSSRLKKDGQKFQKFRIRHNVVYDMSTRPFFCSDFCFNRFLHVRKQLTEEALWVSGERPPIELHFLPDYDTETQYLGVRVEFPDSLVESMKKLSVTKSSGEISAGEESQRKPVTTGSSCLQNCRCPPKDPKEVVEKIREKHEIKKKATVAVIDAKPLPGKSTVAVLNTPSDCSEIRKEHIKIHTYDYLI